MKKPLNNFIKTLTNQDSKSLSQKALKVCEESGELAKVVLPFENASGTIHRFVDRNKILEEIADIYLTAISIAYSLEFSDDDIEDMVSHKAKKWAGLQKDEAKITGKIPYEIHITVDKADRETFIECCNKLEVKPIILALQSSNRIIEDVMTSSVHVGDNRSAYEEMRSITYGLELMGYTVVREKIETVPWHPAAPTETNGKHMPADCYFETHIGVIVPNNDNMVMLNNAVKSFGAHLSRNAFKKHNDGTFTQMVTYRKYTGTYEEFEDFATKLENEIKRNYNVEKRITEFSIYDTKVSHDSAWLLK